MKQRVFIISDTHFSHNNIIKYEHRPFQDTDEMDEYMIEQWNKTVTDNDIVFHLGDVFIGRSKRAEYILNRLKGRIILIKGNHDSFSDTKWKRLGFDPHERYFYKDYLLTHIPVDETPLKVAVNHGLIRGNIHGHTHSQNQHLDKSVYKCCCVELIAYAPILFDEFVERTYIERRGE